MARRFTCLSRVRRRSPARRRGRSYPYWAPSKISMRQNRVPHPISKIKSKMLVLNKNLNMTIWNRMKKMTYD